MVVEALYFTAAGIIIYLASDWILQRAEVAAGKRFEHRSLIFFGIIATLAVVSFALVRMVARA